MVDKKEAYGTAYLVQLASGRQKWFPTDAVTLDQPEQPKVPDSQELLDIAERLALCPKDLWLEHKSKEIAKAAGELMLRERKGK